MHYLIFSVVLSSYLRNLKTEIIFYESIVNIAKAECHLLRILLLLRMKTSLKQRSK